MIIRCPLERLFALVVFYKQDKIEGRWGGGRGDQRRALRAKLQKNVHNVYSASPLQQRDGKRLEGYSLLEASSKALNGNAFTTRQAAKRKRFYC